MSRGWRWWWLAVPAGLLAGCAGEQQPQQTTTVRKSSGDPLLDRYAGNFRYEKADDGTTRIVSDQRSKFEGQQAAGFGKEFLGKEYRTGEQRKDPWWGRQEYSQTEAWHGVKGADEAGRASRFGAQSAADGGRVAAAAGERYDTRGYRTGRAREATGDRLDKPADALTANRREDFPEPYVIGWEKRRELSVEQTKGILGRDE